MKKRIFQVLGVLGLLVALVLIAGSLQPASYHVERSTHIAAPREKVFAVVSDMHRFDDWSPWSKLDPQLHVEVKDGPEAGKGVSYTWSGNDDVGSGTMTIRNTLSNERVDVDLHFLAPWESRSTIAWILLPEGDGTKITWAMDGKNEGVLAKTMSMFMNIDKLIGKDFSEGLDRLKHVVEKG